MAFTLRGKGVAVISVQENYNSLSVPYSPLFIIFLYEKTVISCFPTGEV
jgi:hypothetical protein